MIAARDYLTHISAGAQRARHSRIHKPEVVAQKETARARALRSTIQLAAVGMSVLHCPEGTLLQEERRHRFLSACWVILLSFL